MVRMMIALVLVAGCKQKPAEEMGATPGKSGAMGTSGGAGSAMGTLAPVTADQLAKNFDTSIAGRYEAQLVMISDRTIIAILRETATSKFLARVLETSPTGETTSDKLFTPKSPIAEFPTKLALISKNDELERANLSLVKGKAWAAGEYVAVLADGLAIHHMVAGTPAQSWAFTEAK